MNIDRFLTWFNSTDVNTANVHVSYSNESGYGLYSCQPLIDKDSLILSIPEHLFIKPIFKQNDLTGFEHLIISLLEEKSSPYIEFLRSIQCLPQWRRITTDLYPRQLTNQMQKHSNKYNQSRNKLSQYPDDEFQWAYYTINTRCVYFDMERTSKEQDDNLCLIPYLDFVNHSIEPNTISKFNPLTRSYEIRTIQSINFNEQITFLYNPHSNVDLFIEYGFILRSNPYNQLNIEYDLEQILSREQIQMIQSYHYWNSLQFYSGTNDLSWTILKAIELNINQSTWSPYDDPPVNRQHQLINQIQQLIKVVQQNLDKDFQQWTTDHFITEKQVLYDDFLTILRDTSTVVNKSMMISYILFFSIQFKAKQILIIRERFSVCTNECGQLCLN